MACTMIGPLGGLREVSLVQRGATVDTARASSEMVTLGGRRIVQQAPRVLRTWGMSLGAWRTPEQLAYLTALATGAIPGPYYLYTQDAAQSNLLPADVAAPGAMGSYGLAAPEAATLGALGVLPAPMPSVGVVPVVTAPGYLPNGLVGPWSRSIPLPEGVYTLSLRDGSFGATPRQRIEWELWEPYTSNGAGSSGDTLSFAWDGSRGEGQIVVDAIAAQYTMLRLRRTSGQVAIHSLRLTAGTTQTTDWLPGRGVPQVVIDDPQEVLQMATAGEVRSDYTVTIREVG